MYRLVTSAADSNAPRLIATAPLTAADFVAIAGALRTPPVTARKFARTAARQSQTTQPVETRWNGQETRNTANPGDWIVTSLAGDGSPLRDDSGNLNTYVIAADRFPDFYEATAGDSTFGKVYRSTSRIEAIYLAGGFEIMAPWHVVQRAASGYLLRDGDEVYGNHAETFLASYTIGR